MASLRRLSALGSHMSKCQILNQNLTSSSTLIEQDGIEVTPPPPGYEVQFNRLLTRDAVYFIAELVHEFDTKVDELLRRRIARKIELDHGKSTPDFLPHTSHIRESDWMVEPAPYRLLNRHVDLGDVSPSNTKHFTDSLKSSAQGIQVDFDDGHCPTWCNQIVGMNNVYEACHGLITGVNDIKRLPVLMLRPRAWNMIETHMLVDGKEIPGPLFDFGLLMYHNAQILYKNESGPYFYLSKLECYEEARLWNEIFVWTQRKLDLPLGSIKACVLIENILATFEMHEILYELHDHSAGLNCGIWDYSASFVNKFGTWPEFVLPDRKKYVSMERHFLSSYMNLLVQTCHRRGCHATGGMAAQLLPPSGDTQKHKAVVEAVCRSKLREIRAGVDGFMVYDIGLLQPVLNLWEKFAPSVHQLYVKREDVSIRTRDLLQIPKGGVTLEGLSYNISVGILFIYSWMSGKGHFHYKGSVEDSATAEISRSQVWQWIRHSARLEDNGIRISRDLVMSLVTECVKLLSASDDSGYHGNESVARDKLRLQEAAAVFSQLVSRKNFPEFITTYLSEQYAFTRHHD